MAESEKVERQWTITDRVSPKPNSLFSGQAFMELIM